MSPENLSLFVRALIVVIIFLILYIFYGTPLQWRKRNKRIKELQEMWPEHTLKARFTGWPDGELMAFDIINSDEQRVGYFILTTDGKWMRVN